MNMRSSMQRLVREVAFGAPPKRRRRRAEIERPGERDAVERGRRSRAYLAAVVLPTLVAVALVPVRADHPRIVGLILILPVLATATFGVTGAAVAAAVSAGIAYDVALTEPYYRLTIADSDEVVAMAVIVVVGAVVGVTSGRLARADRRSSVRGRELRHLVQFVDAGLRSTSPDELAELAGGHIADVLGARSWRWHAGYRGGGSATLLETGGLMSPLTELRPDRAELPVEIEIPAGVGRREVGRFVVRSTPGRLVSGEERLTAATIAALLAERWATLAATTAGTPGTGSAGASTPSAAQRTASPDGAG